MARREWWMTAGVLGYLLLYVLPLGWRPLVQPDETRYAEIPREMLAANDFVVPRLNGLRYFEKPILGYGCVALSMAGFGENAFAARLPSAAAAGFSALVILLLVRRFVPERWAGALAAIAFLLCAGVLVTGIVNVLDGPFAMWMTGALAAFFFAYRSASARRVGWLVLMGVLCGAAFLTKGFLALGLLAVVIAPFLIWERRWRLLFTMPWIPLAVATATILPWALAIHARESDFWFYFVWVEHLNRFAGEHAQHKEPLWYYLPVLVGGALPWSPLFPAAAMGLGRTRMKTPLARFATCWFVAPLVLFSLSRGKLETYILPVFPALAILVALGLLAYLQSDGRKALSVGAAVISLIAAVACVVVACYPMESRFYAEAGSMLARKVALSAALGVWSLLAALSLRTRQPGRFLARFCAGPFIFLLTLHLVAGGLYQDKRMPGLFLSGHAQDVGETAMLVSGGHAVSAVCWYYGRDDVWILSSGAGELSYGLGYRDSRERRLSDEDLARFIRSNSGERAVVVIVDEGRYSRLAPQLPEADYEDIAHGFAFARYQAVQQGTPAPPRRSGP